MKIYLLTLFLLSCTSAPLSINSFATSKESFNAAIYNGVIASYEICIIRVVNDNNEHESNDGDNNQLIMIVIMYLPDPQYQQVFLFLSVA